MKVYFESMQVAFSFFTTLPVYKHYEWTKERMRLVPLMMIFVGGVIGGVSAILLKVLYGIQISPFLKSIIMLFFSVFITGGLHIDALMDTSDAFFSRRDIDRRLEIMKDSRVGAFAVIAVFFYFAFTWAVYYEYIIRELSIVPIIFIPIFSRIMQPLMLYKFKFAREDGLAKMYNLSLVKRDSYILLSYFVIATLALLFISKSLWLSTIFPICSILYFLYYKKFTYKNFGGITGDLIGAYLVLQEFILLALSLIIGR